MDGPLLHEFFGCHGFRRSPDGKYRRPFMTREEVVDVISDMGQLGWKMPSTLYLVDREGDVYGRRLLNPYAANNYIDVLHLRSETCVAAVKETGSDDLVDLCR